MAQMERIQLPLPAELLARIDAAAGNVPRTRWIRMALEARLNSTAGQAVGNGAGASTQGTTRAATDPAQPVRPKCDHPNVKSSWTRICPDCQARLRA